MFEPFWRPTQQKHPILTDQMVTEAEATLNFKFPAAYLDLLCTQNGGYIYSASFPADKTIPPAEVDIIVSVIFGIQTGTYRDIMRTPNMLEGWDYGKDFALLNFDGHTLLALDYRECGRQGEPSVVWIDEEMGWEYQLAPDFKTFLEGLVEED